MIKRGIFFIGIAFIGQICSLLITGCAQIGSPTGGPKDTSAPVLIKAIPSNNQTNFSGNKITLNFDEYVDLQDVQSNLLVSPSPKNNPTEARRPPKYRGRLQTPATPPGCAVPRCIFAN